ncbi:unnamed protein product [Pleuronectes platessa]|uniref:Uncharacterized protein n=1 Tax=Pleuronectes platessa TaxID=8262 RepID=A0A9N7TJX6_PLEPL|nr:unnamed protein product [Pleuronectes platessa]
MSSLKPCATPSPPTTRGKRLQLPPLPGMNKSVQLPGFTPGSPSLILFSSNFTRPAEKPRPIPSKLRGGHNRLTNHPRTNLPIITTLSYLWPVIFNGTLISINSMEMMAQQLLQLESQTDASSSLIIYLTSQEQPPPQPPHAAPGNKKAAAQDYSCPRRERALLRPPAIPAHWNSAVAMTPDGRRGR